MALSKTVTIHGCLNACCDVTLAGHAVNGAASVAITAVHSCRNGFAHLPHTRTPAAHLSPILLHKVSQAPRRRQEKVVIHSNEAVA
jgi:hypothetical protein